MAIAPITTSEVRRARRRAGEIMTTLLPMGRPRGSAGADRRGQRDVERDEFGLFEARVERPEARAGGDRVVRRERPREA